MLKVLSWVSYRVYELVSNFLFECANRFRDVETFSHLILRYNRTASLIVNVVANLIVSGVANLV